MRKTASAIPKSVPAPTEPSFNPFFVIASVLTLFVPILVLPGTLDNPFNTPKTVLILGGVCLMAGIYAVRLLTGNTFSIAKTPFPGLLLLVIGLNFFSFFYTRNPYYTLTAATLNVAGLLFMYFLSLHLTGEKAFWLVAITALSGLLVSFETWLQFYDTSALFPWTKPGSMVIGTVGNSNFLGAYLLFPLLGITALLFLFKGSLRWAAGFAWIFVFGALLFSRARAAWVGAAIALPCFLYFAARIQGFSLVAFIRSRPRQAALSALCALALIGLLFAVAPQRFHTMMGFENITNPTSFVLRTQKYFHASWWLFKQSPLFGTGLWSFRNLVYDAQAELHRAEGDFFKTSLETKPRRVHNEFLESLNDGGLVAAAILLLFFMTVMKHGLSVVRREDIPARERIIASAAFSSLAGIMGTALFFFPFRINTTLFMTVLMMGLIEGLYLGHGKFLETLRLNLSGFRYILLSAVLLLFVGWFYYAGYKPLQGEVEHLGYKKAMATARFGDAEKHIMKALKYDPGNTLYGLYAAELYLGPVKDLVKARDGIERAIHRFNGDVTLWSLYYLKGSLAFQTGAVLEAKAALEKSLYYNPLDREAGHKLDEVNKVIKEHDKVMIKFR